MNNNKTFTLVEIVVVIVIMGILLGISTISMVKWFSQSRDVKRKSDLAIISTALNSYQVKNDNFPLPDNSISITYSGDLISAQGVVGEIVTKKLDLKTYLKDPQLLSEYLYAVDSYKNQYQLGCYFENNSLNQIIGFHSTKVYAIQDYSELFLYSIGNNVGLYFSSGTNVSIDKEITGLDIKTLTNSLYLLFPNDYDFYGSGSGIIYNLALNRDDLIKYESKTIGFWPFEENYGQLTYDHTVSLNTGFINGYPIWGEGIRGLALEYDGVDDYVSIPDSNSLDVLTGVTLSVWIKLRSYPVSGEVGIAGKVNDNPGNSTYALSLKSDQKVYGYINSSSNAVFGQIQLNKWYNIVLTYDKVNIVLYIDGERISNFVYNQDITNSILPFNIGKNSGYFDGIIDEVRLYKKALSQDEVKKIYLSK